MTRHPVERPRELVLRLFRPATTARSRKRRRVAAALAVCLIAGAWFEFEQQKAQPSWSDLEHAVEGVPVPGPAHPIRIERWGSDLCTMPVPFAGMCPNDDILVKPADPTTTPEAYRAAWEAALARTGWTQHAPDPAVPDAPKGWWTRERVALILWLRTDNARGPVFEWGDGQLLVEVHEVGKGLARLPA